MGRRAALLAGGSVLLARKAGARGGPSSTVEDLWREWLREEGRVEGRNVLPDGRLVFFTSGTEQIRAAPGSTSWVAARYAAFTAAELQARAELARALEAEVKGNGREFLQVARGEESLPEMERARAELSNADRLRTLAGKALDDAIRHYDPAWDGTGMTEEQRRGRATRLASSIRETVSTRAMVFTAGAMTPVQFEGPTAEGKLSVLVGMVWSNRHQKLAEALWSPDAPVRSAAAGESIAARIAAASRAEPAWAASSNGIRIWTDEKGEKVLVAFGTAPATSLNSLDRTRAHDNALLALQRFVGERLVVNTDGKEAFQYRETADGRGQSFDTGDYRANIVARSRDVTIRGANVVHTWRGAHPIGRADMQVVVLAWSPSSDAYARATGAALAEGEERMRRQGAVPPAPGTPPAGGAAAAPPPAAVPSRTGARTDREDH